MSNLLDRLRARRFPHIANVSLVAGGSGCAVMLPQLDLDIDDAIKRIEELQEERERVAQLARDIHQNLKRDERTPDHGLIGNLRCVLDHVLPDIDPGV
jgi:hypothetical protein